MEENYLMITVNVPVAGDRKEYTYLPAEGRTAADYQIGEVLKVPFGHQGMVKGYLTGFAGTAELDDDKIKEVGKKVSRQPVFDYLLLEALSRMADYYAVSLLSLINAALPRGANSGGSRSREVLAYSLNFSEDKIEEVRKKLNKQATAQSRVLDVLEKTEEDWLPAVELVERAETSRSTLTSLEEKELLQRKKLRLWRKPAYRLSQKGQERESSLEFGRNPQQELKKQKSLLEFENSKSQQGQKEQDRSNKITLNQHQRQVLEKIDAELKNKQNPVFLLHGVTGSGKTEVYLRLIRKTLMKGKSIILLVPEISLTPYLVDFFYSRFPGELALMHSGLSDGERLDEWERIREGEARLVIGARSAVFAPVKDPGLIIIDEEHENTYKQSNYPCYHARGAAVIRAQVEEFPVLLGSATPSLESYYFARQGHYRYLSLPERAGEGEMPARRIIDMKEEVKEGNYGLLSAPLKAAIEERLNQNEQVLLFLNRRGFASFILCQHCGETIKCNNCDITLTYHKRENSLRCHYCDYQQPVPGECPACSSKILQDFGAGTERVEDTVAGLFPGARVSRMDLDTTGRKNSHRKILRQVDQGEVDILIGTQMIAKGHDFHNITLVGVLGTDLILNLPDFRSAERTFQLINQVSGRAGRGGKSGEVLIQTYNPDNFVIRAARKNLPENFYRKELRLRENLFYPPISRLVRILLRAEAENDLMEVTEKVRKSFAGNWYQRLKILGPAPAPLLKIRGEYRYHILLFFNSTAERMKYLPEIREEVEELCSRGIELLVDVDPLSML